MDFASVYCCRVGKGKEHIAGTRIETRFVCACAMGRDVRRPIGQIESPTDEKKLPAHSLTDGNCSIGVAPVM
jgi:hypothetical protein